MKNVAIDIGSVTVEGVSGRSHNAASVRRGIENALGRHLAQLPHSATDAQITAAVKAALDRALRGR
jgi:hypothetical protein